MSGLYRKNVGIVLFNKDKKVLVCARADRQDMNWQFPQGGIDDGEDIVKAAFRELGEETGITSASLIAVLPEPLRYDFPPQVLAHAQSLGRMFVGQEQSWVLLFFSGDDKEIRFDANPEEIEFKAFEWIDIKEAPKRIVPFKKMVYTEVAKAFEPLILNFSQGNNK